MKETHYEAGLELLHRFCQANHIRRPAIKRLSKTERLYYLATCAYYRPETISIMVEKCAHLGLGAQAWSCPGYKIDRTPYGVLQHELGHHVGFILSEHFGKFFEQGLYLICGATKPLTGYLGTSGGVNPDEFYREWFAEHFRLFVTNPQLSQAIAPRFFEGITKYLLPVESRGWREVLVSWGAPARTIEMASRLTQGVIPLSPGISPRNNS